MYGLPLGDKCLWCWWYIQGFPVRIRTLNCKRNLRSSCRYHWSWNMLAKFQNVSTRSVFSGNWQCRMNINPNPSRCLFVVEKYVVDKTNKGGGGKGLCLPPVIPHRQVVIRAADDDLMPMIHHKVDCKITSMVMHNLSLYTLLFYKNTSHHLYMTYKCSFIGHRHL